MLPEHIIEKIYYDYIPIYMQKMKDVHFQLLHDTHWLYLSETLIKFEVDYVFAHRIPQLVPTLTRS